MDAHKLGLDITINMCTPGLVGFGLAWFVFDGQMDSMSELIGYLSLA